MEKLLEGRTAIVTGASQGLGLEIAKGYVKAGANIVMCARNRDVIEKAREEVSALALPEQRVVAHTADVSKISDVRMLVNNTLEAFPRLDILVNNAGIYGPKGPIESIDWAEWVKAIEVNLMGSVLMCRAVIPHFKANRYGKIIQLSGGGATNPLPNISAYAASKAAIIRFAETLAEEVREHHIDVNAIAPGALNTRLLDEVLEAGPEKMGSAFYDRSIKQKAQGGAPLQKGVDLSVYLASSVSDGISGKLFSAIWDPWETLPKHLTALQETDIYTLRRIVPKDRGMDWGDR